MAGEEQREVDETGAAKTGMIGHADALRRVSGEFADTALETDFAQERLPETLRYARLLMLGSMVLNTLFLASDWRFHGTAHFWVAVPARLVTILLALACFLALRRVSTPRGATLVMVAWMVANALAVMLLVTSHSRIALFVVIMLPLIYYLVVPGRFWAVAACGIACSLLMYLGYGEYRASPTTAGGLALALLMLNSALIIVISRSNRLERLQWIAMRSERRIAAELDLSRETLARMFAASPIPMVITDRETGKVVDANDSYRELLGTDPMAGPGTLEPFYVTPGDRQRLLAMIDRDDKFGDTEMQIRTADGSLRTVIVKANAVSTPHGRRIMAGIIDISDRKAVELSLEWLASTDTLTGLPNRHSFLATARAAIAAAEQTGVPLALLMVDLDHFKRINDGWGHQMGDCALRAFATLCLEHLRDDDIIGRLGGEEFGILLPGCDAEAALAAAGRLRQAIAGIIVDPLISDGPRLSASIGVTIVAQGESDLEKAIGRADKALYEAKRMGRNYVVLDPLLEIPSARPH
ncbi:sensor domain-containing diguanylate cyclase [Edaphosphingomonas haloaromaticamans]|uniref:Putative diguanylate cyclase YcdT n=1 Tax=Edaphosphingomonas haloaromaticamans TaxID=653954 RepID=A0A1S1HDV2_9SPHN|nr:sensor domain-containing diguanylate cyclase [Sphingomonas haloaromaticamans]OHT20375.1 putative diguanylate cyclase YcdT [Sphingomonas haloaromaticamans]